MTIEEQLERDEGVILSAYMDSENYLTIGIGRLIDKRKGGGISKAEALILLRNDIFKVKENLYRVLPWTSTLDHIRYAALVNMCFNLGINGLLQFKNALAAMESEQWETAATEMLDSRWAAQVGARAIRLSQQMRTGEWQ